MASRSMISLEGGGGCATGAPLVIGGVCAIADSDMVSKLLSAVVVVVGC